MSKVYKLYSSPYQLSDQPSSKGYLLKWEDAESKVFYSCLHSWKSLDGEDAEEVLKSLKEGVASSSKLLEASYHLAKDFGFWDAEGELSFSTDNHLILGDVNELGDKDLVHLIEGSYSSVKVKIHNELSMSLLHLFHWASTLSPKIKIRLDFNSMFTKEEVFAAFAKLTREELDRIDWVEDPFYYDFTSWKELFFKFGVRPAYDWISWDPNCRLKSEDLTHLEKNIDMEYGFQNVGTNQQNNSNASMELSKVEKADTPVGSIAPKYFGVRVIKPSIDLVSLEKEPLRHEDVLCTSYLAHPLEQLLSSCFCEKLHSDTNKIFGGFCSHNFYPENKYSKLLFVEKGKLKVKSFDKFKTYLDEEEWTFVTSIKK